MRLADALCARAAYATWFALTTPARRRFERALETPVQAQEELLLRIVRENAETEFGRRFGFRAIRSVEEYRRALPVRGYDGFSGDVEAVRRGHASVLTRERVTRLVPSAGSSGPNKLIPFTASLAKSFSAAVAPWIADLAARHPGLTGGPAYWSVSPAIDRPRVESSVPVGFDRDTSYLGRALAPLVERTLLAPEELRHARPLRSFQYLTLRLLLSTRSLRLLSIWHPSFLSILLARASEWWEAIVADVESGTSSPPDAVDARVRAAVLRRTPCDRKRAQELRRLGPRARIAELWPELRVVSAWGDAAAAEPFQELTHACRPIAVEPKGLLATEGCVTIPYAGLHPVAVTSTFVELVDGQGRARGLGEVREGESYDVVVTTSGGLHRYRLGDRVRVDGLVGATPSLRLAGRTDHVVDRAGEKLSEEFVGAAIRRAFAEEAVPPFAMLAAEGPGYALFVDRGPVDPEGLANRLSSALRENLAFAYAQDLGQLRPVRVVLCPPQAAERFVAHAYASGRRLGEVKPARLADDDAWTGILGGREVARAAPAPASLVQGASQGRRMP